MRARLGEIESELKSHYRLPSELEEKAVMAINRRLRDLGWYHGTRLYFAAHGWRRLLKVVQELTGPPMLGSDKR